MKCIKLILYCLFSSCYLLSFSQSGSLLLNKSTITKIEGSVYDTISFHSSIKPFNISDLTPDSFLKLQTPLLSLASGRFLLTPIVNLGISKTENSILTYESGLGFSMGFTLSKKLFIQTVFQGLANKYYPYQSAQIDSYKVVPDWGRYLFKNGNLYFTPIITGSLNYKPRKYIIFSTGYDKFFIGDGYRSLLLSDNAAPYPYANITVNFWRIRYLFMCAYLKDIDNLSANARMTDKYGVFHYLDVNVTNRITAGFYEAIIWWGADKDTKRGFDLEYLNPLIFFRPVEYSMHSPDNANLGGNLKLRLWRKTFLYGQLFIDDLMVKELLANSGWWGNKYGIQMGFKTFNLFNIRKLYVQSECNIVRPFTYSHSSSSLNYGSIYQPLAHPLGANFRELIGIVRYSKGKYDFMAKLAIAQLGADMSKTSYGQNIYKTYDERNDSHNVFLLQGRKELRLFSDFRLSRSIVEKYNFRLFCSFKCYSQDYKANQGLDYTFTIGIKTLLYNDERDY